MKDRVELVGMQFYAYHGCFEEEQRIGNRFISIKIGLLQSEQMINFAFLPLSFLKNTVI